MYIKSNTEGSCTYKVAVQFMGCPETTEEFIVEAPCGADEEKLFWELPFEELESRLEVLDISNNQESYRLTKEEIDYFDSAWGFHGGVPKEEYDEELAEEGYYDDYYDEPQYSGYMTNLDWTVTVGYKGCPEAKYIHNTEYDSWQTESYVEKAAIEDAAEEGFSIVSVELVG